MLGYPRALGQVVIVDAGTIGLDVRPRRRCRSPVNLDATMHVQPQPTLGSEMDSGPPVAGRPIYDIRSMRAA